ncbi:MAG: YeeE/YedE family protein [Nitrosomonas sp.]|nr:YeeE/YedE family protein [Nitrosomonas sp.]
MLIIDWPAFTPLSAMLGGVIIGLATTALLIVTGRVAGISGIVGGLFRLSQGDRGWRIAFIAGLLMAPWIYRWIAVLPPVEIRTSYGLLVLAGLIVGIGTRYGSGCTSGHGVCGLSRLSPRSIVATIIFITTAMATTYVIRHVTF